MNTFYCGCHQPSDAKRFSNSFVSVNRLRERVGFFKVHDWVMDSGAYTELTFHGRHRYTPQQYAGQIRRWSGNGRLNAAVAQDWMCEKHVTKITGLSVERHQELTIQNYLALMDCDTSGVDIIPVIQGREPRDYERHIKMYGSILSGVHWIGVGSVCGRTKVGEIEDVLSAVREYVPPYSELHGFGVKLDAFDSRAARWEGRNQNCWKEGAAYVEKINRKLGMLSCEVFYPPNDQQRTLDFTCLAG